MHRSLGPVLVFVLACGGSSAPSPQAAPPAVTGAPVDVPEATPREYARHVGPKLRVAVTPFTEELPNQPQLAQAGFREIAPVLEEQLVTELVRTGRVTVLERKRLKKIAGEVDLGHGEMAEYFAKSEKVEKGKFLMAQAMFTGAVTEFEPDAAGLSGGVSVAGIGAEASKKTARVGIELRLVDTETGRIIEATHAEGTADRIEGEVSVSYLGIKIGGGGYYKTPLGRATRDALDKAVDFILAKLGDIPWQARIVGVEAPGKVMIRGGADIGLTAGDVFEVVVRARELLDPDNGNTLGFVEAVFGKLQVDEVQAEVSVGHMLDGQRLPPLNAVIRSVGQKPGTTGFVATTGDAAGEGKPQGAPPATSSGRPALEVPMYHDLQPLSPPQGPKATDIWGIPKALYACKKATESCSGEKKPAATVGKDRLVLKRTVEFDTNTATLTPAARNLLDQVAYLLTAQPQLHKVRIEGHTDNAGDANHNLRLSQSRARAVLNYLGARGVDPTRLEAQGFGAQKPVAPNTTDKGKQKNRRVDFVFAQ